MVVEARSRAPQPVIKDAWEAKGLTWARDGETPLPAQLTYPENSLLIVGGYPGAGKSTLLRRLKTEALILNPEQLAEEAAVAVNTREAHHLMQSKVRALMEAGRPVIIDAPAVYGRLRRSYIRLATGRGYIPNLLFIDVPADQARQGQMRRQADGGKEALSEDRWEWYQQEYASLMFDLEYMEEEDMDDRFDYHSITVADRQSAAGIQTISFTGGRR